MNKILNINLGGYALTIDDDAYEYLKNYLEKYASGSASGKDAMKY